MLEDQHRITVTVKPVPPCDGLGVGRLGQLDAADRTHQHEECRAREVKVGQQCVERAEGVSGPDEQIGLSLEGINRAICRGGFESSDNGRPDGHDPMSRAADSLESL